MQKFVISIAVALGLIIPALAMAQTSSTGLLTVYVQVLNQTGYSAFQTYAPGNFTVSVAGNSPSIATFAGSQNGTAVSLLPGSYNVTVTNAAVGYAPSYSVGCNYTIAAGQSQTCVITMTPSYGYNNYPTNSNYYPYYNQVPPLTCQAQTPSVGLGQPVSFQAFGGAGGTFNWTAPYTQQLNYANAGPLITVTFQTTGQETVTVTNAAQTASCSVLVTSGFYPVGSTYPSNYPTNYNGTTYQNTGYNYGTTYQNTGYNYATTPSSVYYAAYPGLPRTGFGPHDTSTGIAFALVMLIAAGVITLPYARKALAIVGR